MPDYNLGRAHGEVVITADTRDATRGLEDYERAQKNASRTAGDAARIEQELTRRREEAAAAANRRKDAEAEYKRVMSDSTSTVTEQTRAEQNRNQARGEALQAARRAAEGERAYQAALRGSTDEVKKFIRSIDGVDESHKRASRSVRDFRSEISQTALASRALGDSLQSTVGIMSKVIGLLAAGGAAGGLLGLLGAGGIQGVIAATEAIKDFSGAILLMPAVVGGAAVVVGTLAAAFNGVGEALSSMDDPAKFTEALQKLAPAAAQAVTIIASFRDALKGAMQQVQESLFQPLVDQIEPLIRTWLPALMQAGQQVASVLGNAGRVVAQWLQQPAQMQAFTAFINNLLTALNGLMPAITPILNAFETLSVVGSQFFPQLAAIIVQIATAFNNWVQGAAQSGDLQNWIQTAITSFEQLFQAVGNVLDAAQNIGRAFQAAGSQGFLDWLVNITQAFREWTESAQGTQILTTFFQNLHQASQLLGPILQTVGTAILQLLNNLIQLGISAGPGIQSFFNSLAEALNILGQSLVASGPALGQILTTLGETLVKIVQQVGPQLPTLFQNLATALVNIAPAAVAVAGALAQVMSHLTPTEIEVILGIVAAFSAISTVVPIIQAVSAAIAFLAANPIVLLIAAIAALVAAVIYMATHWDEVKASLQVLWQQMQQFGAWLVGWFVQQWQSLTSALGDVWANITGAFDNWLNDAYDWGKNLIANLVRGIRDFMGDVGSAAGDIGKTIWEFLKPGSPTKKGPLSEAGGTEAWGAKLATDFSTGLGQGGVEGAAAGVAGTTGMSFSSGGAPGKSGKGTSGFDSWVDNIVQDLRAWSALAQGAFNLFKDVADIVVNTTKVVASLWNKGDNPLTKPGGIFGQPKTPQQQVAGVPAAEDHGKAPLPNLVPQGKAGAPPVPQQTVDGVPSAGSGGTGGPGWWKSNEPKPVTGAPPANPPASTTGQAAPAGSVPLVQNPDGTWTSSDPTWAKLIQRESSGVNQRQKIKDANSGGNEAEGLFQITPSTWKSNGGEQFAPNPLAATPQEQAIVAGRVLNSDPGAWGFYRHPGREDPAALRAGLVPQGGIAPPPAAAVPAVPAPAGAPQITDSPTPSHGGQINPNLFLVHTEEGNSPSAQALADSMRGRTSNRASYNYVIDPNTGAVVRPVPAGQEAWSVGSPGNERSINAVIAGSHADWSKEQWLQHAPALQSLAFLAARDAAQFGIPIEQLGPNSQSGIGGHEWVSQNLGGTDHTDPGPNFPWQEFMGMVRGYAGGQGGPVNVTAGLPAPRTVNADQFGGIDLQDSETPLIGPGGGTPATVPLPQPNVQGQTPPSVQGQAPRFALNPATKARIPLGGTTTQAVARAGLAPLYKPGSTDIPPQIQQFASAFGLKANTRAEGGSLHQAGFAFDLTGKPEDMDRFSDFVQNNLAGQTLELIHSNERTGQKWGIAGGQRVDVPGSQYQNYFTDQYAAHGDFGGNAHVHWATDVPPVILTGDGTAVPVVGNAPNVPTGAPLIGGAQSNTIVPKDVPYRNGQLQIGPGAALPANVQGTYDPNKPLVGAGAQVAPDIYNRLVPQAPVAGQGLGVPQVQPTAPGPSTSQNQKSPMDQFQSGMQAATSIAGDAFTVFNDVITNIKAGADNLDLLVRGFANTEDVNRFIDNFQTFIKTGADIAKLVGDVGGLVGQAGAGDPTGGASAIGGGIQAIAGIVQAALEATNTAIDLGQMAWQQATKYAIGIFAGSMLGGADTGPLSGNVRMLLNTNTGQVQAYSEDNPLNKQTHNMPAWLARSYGGPNPNAQPNTQQTQVNIYTGPGPDARNLVSDTMWLVNSGAATVSVAGQE